MISPKNRPSKKIIYLGIVALLVIAAAFIGKFHTPDGVLGEQGLSYRTGDVPCIDSLSPTDPCVVSAIKETVAKDDSDSDNLTKNLSKSVFTSYLNAQDENGNVAADERINIIQNTVAGTPSSDSVVPVKYTSGGVSTYSSPTSDEIRSYANEFASIYREQLAAYVGLNHPTYDQSAQYYKELSQALSKLKVPGPIAEVHLAVINSYNQMHVSLLDLNNYDNDPLRSFYALTIFRNNQNVLPTLFAKLADYFKKNGIIFSKSEPGSFWAPQ